MLILKDYQTRAIEALKDYFLTCKSIGNADTAFYESTRKWFGQGLIYQQVRQLPGLPYVCIRIPTGGGKTLVACHSVGIAQKELLGADNSLILWLVPSNTIKDQTLKALKDRQHPYRQAVESCLGNLEILDISQALYLQKGVVDNQTVIIVSTMQAFRVEETEGRKVYEQSGALDHHFQNLPTHKAEDLECYEGTKKPIPSLANVLKLHRPIVIVDEAHNARTHLSFDTLARFRPSCIVEFTATPDIEDNPSNVLYRVSAAELKAENMIKIPIQLETRPDWKDLLSDAIAAKAKLEETAANERRQTGEYLRPIMLLQAQRQNQARETLTYDVLEKALIEDFHIPKEQIAIETGDKRELENINLADENCPIRYIITVDALREGWDCPFAYILYTVSESYSSRAVEQILGRILRLPQARQKQNEMLNKAFAYASSPNWPDVARSLQDALINNGFNRLEAKDLIAYNPQQGELFDESGADLPLWASGVHTTVSIAEIPDLSGLSHEAQQVIAVDEATKTITFKLDITEGVKEQLNKQSRDPVFRQALDEAYQKTYFRKLSERNQLRRGYHFSIPVLGIKTGNLFEPFEKTHLLDTPWSLLDCDFHLSDTEYSANRPGASIGLIDVDLAAEFLGKLTDDVSFWDMKTGWTETELVAWLDRNIPHSDIPKQETMVYILQTIKHLIQDKGLSLQPLVMDKFRLRKAIEQKIETHRNAFYKSAYQTLLFGKESPLEVRPEVCFTYNPDAYPYSRLYDKRFGDYKWKKHYYDEMGDFDTKEEFECAIFLDQSEAVDCWVRNLDRRDTSFWLQTSTDRFYPDFVCKLKDGRILVVEYKGEDRWSNDDSREKRELGDVWEKLSNGKCLFIMPKGKDFEAINQKYNS